jgi:PAS domain S-box-containing protein
MKKYFLAFFLAISFAFLGFDIVSSYYFLDRLFDIMQERRETWDEVYKYNDYLYLLIDAETGQRGFVITGDEEHLEPYKKALKLLESKEFKDFVAKENADPTYSDKIKRLQAIREKKLKLSEKIIKTRREQGFEQARDITASKKGKHYIDEMRDLIGSIIEEKRQILFNTDQQLKELSHTNLALFILRDLVMGLIIGCLLLFLYFYFKELQQKDQQLSQTAHKLGDALATSQAILNAASYAVISTDTHLVITSINPAGEALLGYRSEDLVGKVTPAIFHDQKEMEDRAIELSTKLKKKLPISELFKTLAQQSLVDTREWTYIRKDGTRFPVQLSITTIKNHIGEIVGYLGIAQDLTEHKKFEKMRQDLVAIVSHELRLPIAALKGTFDVLFQQGINFPDQHKRILEIGKKNCEKLASIVNDLIDLEQLQAGKLTLNFRKTNLAEFLAILIQDNLPLVQKSKVEISYHPVPNNWFVEADESRLLQAMQKLISSTINYSRNKKKVDISFYKVNGKVHVEVKNEDTGIQLESNDQAFDPFIPNSFVFHSGKEGMAIELNLAKSIIEKHHGKIGFKAVPNQIIFWFELPVFEASV